MIANIIPNWIYSNILISQIFALSRVRSIFNKVASHPWSMVTIAFLWSVFLCNQHLFLEYILYFRVVMQPTAKMLIRGDHACAIESNINGASLNIKRSYNRKRVCRHSSHRKSNSTRTTWGHTRLIANAGAQWIATVSFSDKRFYVALSDRAPFITSLWLIDSRLLGARIYA